jgi:signal transduction histidine kinase
MRERVALLGGQIDIQSGLGKGTKVQIAIPV